MQNASGAVSSTPSLSVEFRCHASSDVRNWLSNLLREACALEVSLPQTRWLWQLALAVDPDCPGALHPRVAYEDEMALRQRCDRRRLATNEEPSGTHRRTNSRRFNASERPFYVSVSLVQSGFVGVFTLLEPFCLLIKFGV